MADKVADDVIQLDQDRRTRDNARALFDQQLDQVKNDIAARGVGGRVLDSVTGEARSVLSQGVEIAEANKSVVAGTIAALVLWFLRNPIIAQSNRWLQAIKRISL